MGARIAVRGALFWAFTACAAAGLSGQAPPLRWHVDRTIDISLDLAAARFALVAVDNEGRAYIATSASRAIALVDANGHRLANFDVGPPPDPRSSIRGLALSGDTLLVLESAPSRLLALGRGGDHLAELQLENVPARRPFYSAAPVAVLLDGSVLAAPSLDMRLVQMGAQREVPLVRGTRDGRLLSTVADISAGNLVLYVAADGDVVLATPSPLLSELIGQHTLWKLSSDRRSLVMVEPPDDRGRQRLLRIDAITADTTLARNLSLRRNPMPRAALDSLIGALEAVMAPSFHDRQRLASALQKSLDVPLLMPRVFDLAVGRDGWMWLLTEPRAGAREAEWWVFDKRGNAAGRVRLPANITLIYADGRRAWGTRQEHGTLSQVLLILVGR